MTAPSFGTDLLAYNFNLETNDFLTHFCPPPGPSQIGQSFLHDLAREDDVLTAELVLDTGLDADRPDAHDRRPLHEAAAAGSLGMITLLLEHGARIDTPLPILGHTALYLASEQGRLEAARLLLAKGARPDVQDALSGQGLLHLAAAKGDLALAGLLIAAGIDVFQEDARGLTARDYAARYNHTDMERALLKVMEHRVRA